MIGLETDYGLKHLVFRPHRIGTQYVALDHGTIDDADVITTDGQLQGPGYVVLKDTKNVFGFQNVEPLVRQKVLDAEGPLFSQTLNAVSAKLFFFQAEDGIRDYKVTGVQTCALPI